MRNDPADLSAVCLKHLRREEEVLRDKRETLRSVRAALVGGPADALDALRESQEEAARATERLRVERDRFRWLAGELLQLPPETVTVRRVVDALPEDERGPVRAAWSRLLDLATEVEKLNRDNAAVIDYCLGFTRSCLLDITGGGRSAGRYGPGGAHLEAPCGSLLEARG